SWSAAAPSRARSRMGRTTPGCSNATGRDATRETDSAGPRFPEAGGDALPAVAPRALRTACGIGLRAPHVAELMERRPSVPWVEVHAENYMGGGPAPAQLDAVRREYPVALHGVGLSLATDGAPD